MIELKQGDCSELIKGIPNDSIDCIICDPPYNINFCSWDNGFNIEKMLMECKRVLKPNGNIIIFQGYTNVCQTKQIMDELFTLLDFCMGTGVCGEVCRNLNRSFVGIELDSKYFNIAKNRIIKQI